MYRPGYIYLHRYMCHIINISPKSSSSFWPAWTSLPPHQRQYGHRIYIFMNLQVIQSSVAMWALSFFLLFGQSRLSYYKRFSASHSYGCDLTTNATLRHPSPLLKYKKNISLYKYSVSWVKKMLYLFSQQFFIYLQTATTTLLRNVVKLVASLLVATLLPITVHWTAGFTCC